MNDFTFQNTTKVYFGRNQLGHLHEAVLDAVQADRRALGTADTGGERPVRVLLVYGGGSIKRMGLYDRVRAELKDSGIEVLDLGGVEPNPRHTTVNRGAALCKEHGVAAVLGVGGGSSIDCAKAVAAAACYTGTDVWDLVEGAAPLERALPVFAMPTMASTGSEMDKSCVISNVDLDAKRGLSSELIRPRASFLNPENTFTVSAYQTACGAFDILSHFLDLNYLANCEKYDLQNGVIESIMRTVVKNAPIALAEPDNYAARQPHVGGELGAQQLLHERHEDGAELPQHGARAFGLLRPHARPRPCHSHAALDALPPRARRVGGGGPEAAGRRGVWLRRGAARARGRVGGDRGGRAVCLRDARAQADAHGRGD